MTKNTSPSSNTLSKLRPKRDWAALDKQHQRRGTLAMTLMLDPAVLAPPPQPAGHRGRPYRYSNVLMEAACLLRTALKLPFRVLEGMLRGKASLRFAFRTTPRFAAA